jgi:hypothetical protein
MYCIYFHKHPLTEEIVYIGHGRKDRAYSRAFRNNQWKDFISKFPNYTVEIYQDNLTKSAAHELESELLKRYSPSCNAKIKQTLRSDIPELFAELFYVDPSSPTGLRHKIPNKGKNLTNRKNADDPAGSQKYQQDGRPHGWQVMVGNKSYLVHRIIWALVHGDMSDGEMVVDHIDRNPFNNNLENLRIVNYRDNALNASKKKTNTSGIVGLHRCDNKGHPFWTGSKRIDGVRTTKNFSVGKYGEETARLLALTWLNN